MAMAVNPTGGGREVVAPKGPRTPPTGAPPSRYLNKASGRMETTQQMKGYKPSTRVSAAARVLGAPTGVAQHPPGPHPHPAAEHEAAAKAQKLSAFKQQYPGTKILNPGGFNPIELGRIERTIQGNQQTQNAAQLLPFQQKGKEIEGNQRAVSGRYGEFANQTQGLLQGLVGQSEASAKSFENHAAESALQAQRSVETAGQNATTLNAGYVDPQVRAAMEAGSANVRGIGAAQEARAREQGQANVGYANQIRATAALRAQEGQGAIASRYGQMAQQNRGKESEVLARNQARAKELGITLPKELLTSKLATAKLGNEGVRVQQQGELGRAKVGATLRGQNITAGTAGANRAQREKASERTRESAKERAEISKLSVQDKARYDKARIEIDRQKKEGKAPSPAAGRKYLQTLNNALSTVRSELARGEKKGYRGQQLYNVARKQLEAGKYTGKGGAEPGAAMGQNLVDAALNLAVYGRLSAPNRAEAEALGLTRQLAPPQWFRTR